MFSPISVRLILVKFMFRTVLNVPCHPQELISNDRVIGGLTPEATDAGCQFYSNLL